MRVQEWLDKNYPKEERSRIEEIYLNEPNLEGELDLKGFNSLEKILISYSVDKNKLKVTNKKKRN